MLFRSPPGAYLVEVVQDVGFVDVEPGTMYHAAARDADYNHVVLVDRTARGRGAAIRVSDRKSVAYGRSVDLGGRRTLKQKRSDTLSRPSVSCPPPAVCRSAFCGGRPSGFIMSRCLVAH